MDQLTIYVPIPPLPQAQKYDELMLALARLGFGVGPSMILTDELKEQITVRGMTITLDSLEQLKEMKL